MQIIYPSNPLNPKSVEDIYGKEHEAAKELGIKVAIFDDEVWSSEELLKTRPSIDPNERVLYRGWMLPPTGYQKLSKQIEMRQGSMVTSTEGYVKAHHIDGWYDDCADLTATTILLGSRKEVQQAIEKLSWSKFFIKDFVKSNSGAKGSVAGTAEEADEIIDELEVYRGEIEGGIALREYEEYVPTSERRYFVADGKVFSSDNEIPKIVETISARLFLGFYSVDIIETPSGEKRLVELGDGQVSDLKEWDPIDFTHKVLRHLAEAH